MFDLTTVPEVPWWRKAAYDKEVHPMTEIDELPRCPKCGAWWHNESECGKSGA